MNKRFVICLAACALGWLPSPSPAVVVATDLVPDQLINDISTPIYNVDVNGDGARDVQLRAVTGNGFQVYPDNHVRIESYSFGDPGAYMARAVATGELIGPSPVGGAIWQHDTLSGGHVLTYCFVLDVMVCYGLFTFTQAHVGLELTLNDGVHYGWLDINGSFDSGALRAYAWETEPGVPITAPEPSRLLLVLLGLSAWVFRRRRLV